MSEATHFITAAVGMVVFATCFTLWLDLDLTRPDVVPVVWIARIGMLLGIALVAVAVGA